MSFTEEYFDGPAQPMPPPIARGTAQYTAQRPSTSLVRHVGGYAAFLRFAAQQQLEQTRLDFSTLVYFVAEHGERIVSEPELRSAAAVFVGNSLISLRSDAFWRAYEGRSPTAGNRARAFEVESLVDRVYEGGNAFAARYVAFVEEWVAL